MRVTVRLFARLRELAGRGAWDVRGAGRRDRSPTSGARRRRVIRPSRRSRTAISCAVNATFARMTDPVADGDEVAFLPPVSGG